MPRQIVIKDNPKKATNPGQLNVNGATRIAKCKAIYVPIKGRFKRSRVAYAGANPGSAKLSHIYLMIDSLGSVAQRFEILEKYH
jgi:hypothetical protein